MNPFFIKVGMVYLITINVFTFFIYGIDKRKAIHHRFRIPEATLLLLAYIGGAYGAALGMKVWHHKTRKTKFRILVPLAMVFWTVLIGIVGRFAA